MKVQVRGQRQVRHLALAVFVVIVGVAVGSASPISYSVSRTIGIGSVTGFIETDGTLGVLGAGNFVDWSLLLNDGTNTYSLYGPLSGNNSSVYLSGVDTTATANQILFNFSGTDNGYLLFQYGVNVHDGFHYYCDATFSGICYAGESVAAAYIGQGENVTRSGNVVIAGSAVPEPASYGLMLTGLGLVMGKVRNLRTRKA